MLDLVLLKKRRPSSEMERKSKRLVRLRKIRKTLAITGYVCTRLRNSQNKKNNTDEHQSVKEQVYKKVLES